MPRLVARSLVAVVAVLLSSIRVNLTDERDFAKGSASFVCAEAIVRTEALACGDTTCHTNADCPSTCGPCVEWSGTCALFQPRGF